MAINALPTCPSSWQAGRIPLHRWLSHLNAYLLRGFSSLLVDFRRATTILDPFPFFQMKNPQKPWVIRRFTQKPWFIRFTMTCCTLTSNPDSTHLPSCWPPSVSPDAPLPECLRTTRGIADGGSGHPLPFPCRPWRLQGCLKTGGPTLATDQKLLFLLHQTSLKWLI